jgi:prevent-host-death family protein
MKRVSVRDLRQNASVWLREVKAGASFEVTERGQPIAMLVPLPKGSVLAQLIAEGKVRPARGDLLDLGPPLPLPPGARPLSEILAEMRADER